MCVCVCVGGCVCTYIYIIGIYKGAAEIHPQFLTCQLFGAVDVRQIAVVALSFKFLCCFIKQSQSKITQCPFSGFRALNAR